MLPGGYIIDLDDKIAKDALPSVQAACLRRAILQTLSQPKVDHLTLDKLLYDYARCVDNMKGLNNYADAIMRLAQGCENDSAHWRSSLQPEDIMNQLNTQDNQENIDGMTESPMDSEHLSKLCNLLSGLFSVEERAPEPGDSAPVLPSSELVSPNVPRHEGGQVTTFPSRPSTKRPCPGSSTVVRPTVNSETDTCESKRSQIEQEVQPRPDNMFKTAGAVLQQNIQMRQPGDARLIGYGSSRRTLGGRRGPGSRFVPPVLGASTGSPGAASNSQPPASIADNPAPFTGEEHSCVVDERLKQFDAKIIDLISSEIMDSKCPVAWEDIAGLEFQKKTLKEVVILPMLRPDLFTGLRGPPKGLLLFGPPGTGKTLIGKCIASQSQSTFFSISASSLTSKWVGEGEKMVRALFAIARIHQPAVIFVDEVDSLLTQRSETEHESSRRIKTEFLVQLDGVSTGPEERLLFIGATNRPQELDEAARRRFVKRLYIPLPDWDARRCIVHHLLKQQRHSLTTPDFAQVADWTDGYSGADMTNLCREAAMGPIRSLTMEAIQSIACDEIRPVELTDFEAALRQVRPSVSSGDLEHYLKWNKQYGSFGT